MSQQLGQMVMVMVMVALGLCHASPLQINPKAITPLGHLGEGKGMGMDRSHNWGVNMTTTELIETMGYPSETHHVTTSDGYILELHRIPHGINHTATTTTTTSTSSSRPVALLVHGLVCSSADFIMNTPDQAIAYLLADDGYDVWMTNLRGNTYSRNHTHISPDDIKFWNFNWDESAVHDVPASIDYILDKTGQKDLYYVGWSMGTTVFWGMMSERPEYNDKVRAMAALAPVAYMNHAKGPFIEFAPYTNAMDTVLSLLGVGEFLPSGPLMDYLADNWCDSDAFTADFCYNFLFLIAGPDPEEINKEFLPTIMAHTPAGSSVHTINHYGQTVQSGKFQKYDYGLLGNLNHYGQSEPPVYNLNAVTTPVALLWGQTDWLATPKDVEHLASQLPNVALNHRVDREEFNHLDFGWSIHTYEYVNRHVLDFFAKY